jgi:hypothetical protein
VSADRSGSAKPSARRLIPLAIALSSVSCADVEGEPVQVAITRTTVAFTPDPSNERVEGTFSVAFTAGDTSAEIESFGVALTDTNGAALSDVTFETDAAFPILMKERTEARVNGRFGAASPLEPPPDMTGWCAEPTLIQLQGMLDTDLSDAPYAIPMPAMTIERAVPIPDNVADVGALWATQTTDGEGKSVRELAIDAAGNVLVSTMQFDEFPALGFFRPSPNSTPAATGCGRGT